MPTLAHSSLIDRSKKFPTLFYESASGNQPVREWILALSVEDRKLVGRDIQKVEFGWPLGMPYWECVKKSGVGRSSVLNCPFEP